MIYFHIGMPKCGSTTFQHLLHDLDRCKEIVYLGELPTKNVGQAVSHDAMSWNKALPYEVQQAYLQFKKQSISLIEFRNTIEGIVAWAKSLDETKDIWLSSEFIMSPQFLQNISFAERVAVLQELEDVNYLIISRPISQVISSIYRDTPNIYRDSNIPDDELLTYVLEQYELSAERILAYSSKYIEHLISGDYKSKFFLLHLNELAQHEVKFEFTMGVLRYETIQRYFSENLHNSGISSIAFLFRKISLGYVINKKTSKHKKFNQILKSVYHVVLRILNKIGSKKTIKISEDVLDVLDKWVQNAIK